MSNIHNLHGTEGNINVNITLDKTYEYECDNCGNDVFTMGLKLRKVKSIYTGDTQDQFVMPPQQVFYCVKCHTVPPEFDLQETQIL